MYRLQPSHRAIRAIAILGCAWRNTGAQIVPAPGACSMAHCNNQMTDFLPVSSAAPISAVTSKSPYIAKNEGTTGVGAGLGCVSNGLNVVCSYKGSVNAVVYYKLDGTALWSSGAALDGTTWASAPIIQADGSVVIGDDKHIVKYNGSGSIAWSTSTPGGGPVSLITMPDGTVVSATHSVSNGRAPVSAYSGVDGTLIGSYSVSAGPGNYYETVNTPCVNNGSNLTHIYVSMQLNKSSSEGALYAIAIDPTNTQSPVTPVWSVAFGGPSGASPLCAGDSVYFDGANYQSEDGSGTTLFGVHDNGASGAIVWHQSLGAEAQRVTCNFALDPRPENGGFWHQLKEDPSIYHRRLSDGSLMNSINVNALLVAGGAQAPPAAQNYWMRGVFTSYGYSVDGKTSTQPYFLLSESDYFPDGANTADNTASYLAMVDITRSSLVWALPIYFPGNPNNFTDTPEGAATLNPGTNGNPVIATASSYSGAYFIGFH